MPTDLAVQAREVCERHNTPQHPCSVHVEGQGSTIGEYDPNRILQLIENLVENAVKYSPDGDPVIVSIWRERASGEPDALGAAQIAPGEWNHLIVTDSGIGIPTEDLPNIFERFHRGSNVDDRQFAGMGLGLFICKSIVEQHGGRIWVQSPPSTCPASSIESSVAGHQLSDEDERRTTEPELAKDRSQARQMTTGNRQPTTDNNRGTAFHVLLPALPATAAAQSSLDDAPGRKAGR